MADPKKVLKTNRNILRSFLKQYSTFQVLVVHFEKQSFSKLSTKMKKILAKRPRSDAAHWLLPYKQQKSTVDRTTACVFC